jgi:hypothetical protein
VLQLNPPGEAIELALKKSNNVILFPVELVNRLLPG